MAQAERVDGWKATNGSQLLWKQDQTENTRFEINLPPRLTDILAGTDRHIRLFILRARKREGIQRKRGLGCGRETERGSKKEPHIAFGIVIFGRRTTTVMYNTYAGRGKSGGRRGHVSSRKRTSVNYIGNLTAISVVERHFAAIKFPQTGINILISRLIRRQI